MSSRIVKIGIVGLGNRGVNGWIRTCQLVKTCRLTAICDQTEALVKKGMAAVGDSSVAWFTDYDRMLMEADVDAVVTVVEPENNADLICRGLEAGKHVVAEVPLCYTIEDCWRIIDTVEKTGLKFSMAEQVRYSPFILAWKKMVEEGRLGKILFVEGQYLHGMGNDRYWHDVETGERLTLDQAKDNPKARKSRFWEMSHPILYLPHELSPILSVLNDRVTRVTCMATRKPSYHHEWFPHSDLEVALMHTEKDTILRLACSFTIPTAQPNHWYHFMGTKGRAETNRFNLDRMKLWLPEEYMTDPAEVNWQYSEHSAPAEARASGHGGLDFSPLYQFIDCILNDTEPPMNVYQAVETAAPAILAGQSADQGSVCLEVPEFRAGKTDRQEKGEY